MQIHQLTPTLVRLGATELHAVSFAELLDIIATPGRRVVVQAKPTGRTGIRTLADGSVAERPVWTSTAVDIDARIAYLCAQEGKTRSALNMAAALNPQAHVLGRREYIVSVTSEGAFRTGSIDDMHTAEDLADILG